MSYSGLSMYNSPATICGYNYANGLACVLAGIMVTVLLHFSLAQVAIYACLVLSNGYLHV